MKFKQKQKILSILSVMAVGAIATYLTFAASGTNVTSFEAESADITGNASIVSDSGASGGQAVEFEDEPASTACSSEPGAPAGSATQGLTTYDSSGTTTVSNVIFDGSHSDDLVRVYNGKVIFENVTFRGTGTGSTGHTLEIKQGGSAEVRNSVFEGSPTEDTIQTENNGVTLIECNQIAGSPGEDHFDLKDGAEVTYRNNSILTRATYQTVQNANSTGPAHFINNTGMHKVLFEDNFHDGSLVGNEISDFVWLYDTQRILVEGNTVNLMKHGEWQSPRVPSQTYFIDNDINSFQFNGGTCYKSGDNGASLSQCTSGAPAWY